MSTRKMDLAHYPLHAQQNVAWGDMDAFQHVNNVIYYRYMESARLFYFQEMDLLSKEFIPVISESNCRYFLPVTYPDQLIIGVRIEEIRTSAIRMSYLLYSTKLQRHVAYGEAVSVYLDAKTLSKIEIPDHMRNKIIELEKQVGNHLI